MDIEAMIKENTPLVHYIIRRYYSKYQLDEDFIQVGMIGLWRSCELFDESKGIKFSTYAYKSILNTLNKELSARNQLDRINTVSLDAPFRDTDDFTYKDFLESPEQYTEIELYEKLKFLTNEEKEILRFRYEGYTYREISRILGVSKQTVCNRVERVKSKLAG